MSDEITTISHLPPEIWAQVIVLARPHKLPKHILPIEVVLSHVCSDWRSVVISSPELWANIKIFSPKSLAYLPTYLQRSGGWPLSLFLDLYDAEKPSLYRNGATALISSAFLDTLAELVVPHVSRWRRFVMFTIREANSRHFLAHVHGLAAPLLECVKVLVEMPAEREEPATQDASSTEPLVPFSGGVPLLKRLDMESVYSWPPVSNLTFLQLQRLTEESMTFQRVVDGLKEASNLKTLLLHRAIDCLDWPINAQPILELNHLEVLSIVGDGLSISKLLLALSAPALRSLWLESTFATGDGMSQLMSSTQFANPEHKFPELRYLTLQLMNLQHVSSCARLFPTVSHLHLSFCPTWGWRYLHDIFKTTPVAKWGNLKTLIVRTSREDSRSNTVLPAVLAACRQRAEAGLKIDTLLSDQGCLEAFGSAQDILKYTNPQALSLESYDEPLWVFREMGDERF
ncbi:hypothetical protein BDN72DRAFT_833066 [Pluteus cervinus]|uniref:Uncharacterized protein n=1 Tax=Pluteus cervinus TaxID=181527 RepID=A0ACD3B8T8_9AGAR|nr:hypothetical protein BDN72DRAFT_833066 [Pluteus cervinus]